jgi:hypothetical protein
MYLRGWILQDLVAESPRQIDSTEIAIEETSALVWSAQHHLELRISSPLQAHLR